MVARAFDAGWGGVVWKTVGEPITNVTSRLGALDIDGRRIVGLSNIELISDRPIEVNLAEVADVKRRYPNQAVVVSLMVESKAEPGTTSSGASTTPAPMGSSSTSAARTG